MFWRLHTLIIKSMAKWMFWHSLTINLILKVSKVSETDMRFSANIAENLVVKLFLYSLIIRIRISMFFTERIPCSIENDLISHTQSGFKLGDSYINRLLSIAHKIYKSFDEGYKTRGVFLDMSNTFNKVWHEGLVHKLKKKTVDQIIY